MVICLALDFPLVPGERLESGVTGNDVLLPPCTFATSTIPPLSPTSSCGEYRKFESCGILAGGLHNFLSCAFPEVSGVLTAGIFFFDLCFSTAFLSLSAFELLERFLLVVVVVLRVLRVLRVVRALLAAAEDPQLDGRFWDSRPRFCFRGETDLAVEFEFEFERDVVLRLFSVLRFLTGGKSESGVSSPLSEELEEMTDF